MALPRKKSRLIKVDGLEYRYKVSTSAHDQNWNFDLTATIQIAHGKGAALIISGLITRDFWLDFPSISDHVNAYPVILPSHIESFIRQGLREGWKPEISGSTKKLKLENDKVFK